MLRKTLTAAVAAMTVLAVASCSTQSSQPTQTADGAQTTEAGGDTPIVLGFSQVGAESGWRTANTDSIKSAAEEAGITLQFSDAQQKQENQITAIRNFITQGVDVIAFSPVVETGWDTVLNEAKDAGIPVVLTDRAVDSEDESLYVTFIGSDFVLEGERAGDWAVAEFADADAVSYVTLEGTTGAAPAIDRDAGWDNVVGADPKFTELATQTGDFTRSGGKTVMEAFLQAHQDIDLVYAHNDDMGLGAIEAIEAAGLRPGVDIKIVTVDAVKDGMTALAEGRISFIVECNPLLGPVLMETVQTIMAGGEVPPRIVTEEATFTPEQAAAVLDSRLY